MIETKNTSDEVEVPRDRWGRPLLPDPVTGRVEPYARATTLAKTLDDTAGLMRWKVARVVQGLRSDPHLLTAHDTPEDIAEAAVRASGPSAAEYGTAMHAMTEAADRGLDFVVPEVFASQADAMSASLSAYLDAMQALEVVGVELFVACREVMAAGTLDRVVRHEGRLFIADIKTGKSDPEYPHTAAIQMAVYAHGTRWDPVRGWLVPMHEHVDLERALMVHLPASGGCTLHWVDIAAGWEMARTAAQVREWRRSRPARGFA